MHPVAIFDFIFLLACLAGFFFLLKGWKTRFNRGTKLLLAGLLFFSLIYSFCLFVEWSGITKALDTFEDFIGAILPLWWAFVFYAFIQEISRRDLAQSEEFTRACLNATTEMVYLTDCTILYHARLRTV